MRDLELNFIILLLYKAFWITSIHWTEKSRNFLNELVLYFIEYWNIVFFLFFLLFGTKVFPYHWSWGSQFNLTVMEFWFWLTKVMSNFLKSQAKISDWLIWLCIMIQICFLKFLRLVKLGIFDIEILPSPVLTCASIRSYLKFLWHTPLVLDLAHLVMLHLNTIIIEVILRFLYILWFSFWWIKNCRWLKRHYLYFFFCWYLTYRIFQEFNSRNWCLMTRTNAIDIFQIELIIIDCVITIFAWFL